MPEKPLNNPQPAGGKDADAPQPCWVCGEPSTWKVTGEKEGEPKVIVEFAACEKHVPFVIAVKSEKAHAAK